MEWSFKRFRNFCGCRDGRGVSTPHVGTGQGAAQCVFTCLGVAEEVSKAGTGVEDNKLATREVEALDELQDDTEGAVLIKFDWDKLREDSVVTIIGLDSELMDLDVSVVAVEEGAGLDIDKLPDDVEAALTTVVEGVRVGSASGKGSITTTVVV